MLCQRHEPRFRRRIWRSSRASSFPICLISQPADCQIISYQRLLAGKFVDDLSLLDGVDCGLGRQICKVKYMAVSLLTWTTMCMGSRSTIHTSTTTPDSSERNQTQNAQRSICVCDFRTNETSSSIPFHPHQSPHPFFLPFVSSPPAIALFPKYSGPLLPL